MHYDILVIGAGHAGIEAALASSRMGCKTALITLKKETIGLMSCNPAIGGVGKGQLVKEIDALGGAMGLAADACGIQFRILNASKGAAVHSSRAQIDMYLYNKYMIDLVTSQKNLTVIETEVTELLIEDGIVRGIKTSAHEEISATCVVIAAGTFLNGLIHVGLEHRPGGRIHEQASVALAKNLVDAGLTVLRFKTGTCPRLDKNSINYSGLKIQEGDNPPQPFSFSTKKFAPKQVPCHITYTNTKTHQIIRDNLDRSPLYAGKIKATGVRYCPSIEDKIVKFSDKDRHQVFLEPQGLTTNEIYPNGISTSLPEDVQLDIIHSIEGLAEAKVITFGYGIEHGVVEPTQLFATLETKAIKNLYLAGQINGTTGYEEAASQGLIAGINAALRVTQRLPLVLDRASGYIGVLIDDLTTKGTNEPYRMFTSRVEYRLILREDNADQRLAKFGYDLGLVSLECYRRVQEKEKAIAAGISFLNSHHLKPSAKTTQALEQLGTAPIRRPTALSEILKRPQITFAQLRQLDQGVETIPDFASAGVEIDVKYAGFVTRQLAEVERFKNLEKIKLSADMDYTLVSGLSREIREKLTRFKPLNLGQASRISGVTPAAISILMVYLKKLHG
ncbi:MAG TPA: tRNA uridine-5-carboxymethylaminomethyl(34) synthesis enzyme MnmG [Candidatus Omnitrophota bacterium]|nr:tRNA uridine-5-carboxymethylaminomethyl(34) synthesis enzyme MnmG [Candidatus Omnitrophota bacterium]HPT07986.1 tRNA uridine-5-carboxymethylaminomethyl(34) synthesis enzyme MnmG [Candidatus Omnitrophota bacterium]